MIVFFIYYLLLYTIHMCLFQLPLPFLIEPGRDLMVDHRFGSAAAWYILEQVAETLTNSSVLR